MSRYPKITCLWAGLGIILMSLAGCAKKPAPASLVVLNGDIHTVDPSFPQATALVVTGNRITAICASDREAKRYVGPKTRVIDLNGKFVLPGLIDGHVHFAAAGAMLDGANLMTVSDEEGLRKEVQRVVNIIDEEEWITDGLWGAYEQWTLGDSGQAAKVTKAPWRPNRKMIDDITPNHPCFLSRFDRKEWLANSLALKEAGLDAQRLPGLEIGSDGRPTGIVFRPSPAFDRMLKARKPKSEMRLLDESRAGLRALREAGITEIHDIESPEQTKRFLELEANGELTCRVWLRPDLSRGAELKAQGFIMGFHPQSKQKSSWLRYGALKGYIDGIMGDHGARLVFGSDWPGTSAALYHMHPKYLIYAAVTRKTLNGTPDGGWFPEEKISVEEAIRAYTINGAYAAFEEDVRGSLKAGKLADITIFDRNLLKIPPEDILKAEVTHTIVDGKIVYRRRS